MALDDGVIGEIVRRILTVAEPDRVILFGSAATDDMTRDSDIDLLVVERDPGNTRARSVSIRRALGAIGYPIDVIVMSVERFEETKDLVGGIAFPASKYGKLIYGAP